MGICRNMTIYIKILDIVQWEKERDVDDDGINCLQKFEVGRKTGLEWEI